ncbi:hypothetical protein OHT77_15395 [Streptomyces sp. NBC_00252]|uniref:hypothetical protein n=1 Tax=Streptomyces sp. NBC_00252 TaxID=2975691 RepID=UPI002E297E02|nr:hypothetical protein [Streptomyces sp. NBC_00252]
MVRAPEPETTPQPDRESAAASHALLDEVVHGCDGIKPGWIRLNFNYFISDTARDTSSTQSS